MTYNRYTNGKIYQITNNLNDMIYIGSTCLPLRKRWYNHKNVDLRTRLENDFLRYKYRNV